MTKRASLLVFTRWYLPGYKAGGPIRSIQRIVELISDDIDVKIFTTNKDLGESESYSNINSNKWRPVNNNVRIFYCSKRFSFFHVIRSIRDSNVIYLNSFFDPYFALVPLIIALTLKKRVVLAPRGEFSKGALQIKFLKKYLYLLFFRCWLLKNKILWHATNELEKKLINDALGGVKYSFIANNIVLPPRKQVKRIKKEAPLKLYFLSRIARKKNLLYALEVLRDISSHIEFSIYGPLEDKVYWNECLVIIRSLPKNINVLYKGEVQHADISDTILRHHALFFPTLGENFGHNIAESLANGIPVIISDRTPWTSLYVKGAGWDLSLQDKASFVSVINELSIMNSADFQQLRLKTLKFYSLYFNKESEEYLHNYLSLFHKSEN